MVLRAIGNGDRGLGSFAVMVGVVAAEHLRIKLRPGIEAGSQRGFLGRFVPQAKGVAGGADADDGLAGGDVGADGFELVLRRQAAAGADEEDVRLVGPIVGRETWNLVG